jgi:hypothetical protein
VSQLERWRAATVEENMTLEIANETDGVVHVALYKRSPLRPAEPAVAWAIASPPPRGRAIFSIPRDYRVFARYSFSPEDPWQPVYQTNPLSLQRNHDSLAIREVSFGRSALGAILARNAKKKAGLGELRIENNFLIGVWCHVQLGEHDVHLPRLLPPRGVLTEALISPFFLAVVNPQARVGAPLSEEEMRTTEIELATGERGVFTVRLNPRQGYRITQGAPLPAEQVTQPKKAAAPVRTKRATPTRESSAPALAPTRKAPRASEKKARATPKADIQKKEDAKRRVKEATGRGHGRGKTKKNTSSLLPASASEPQTSA